MQVSGLPDLEEEATGADISNLRLVIVSDAAPDRNGVGTYYQDLLDQLAPELEQAEVFSPTVEEGKWNAGAVLPLPGDSTQKLCFPNPWSMQRSLSRVRPHVLIVPTPGVYGLAGAFLASRMNIPVLVVVHTAFDLLTDLYWRGSIGGLIAGKYFEQSHDYLFKVARRIVVTSPELCDLVRRISGREADLVPTPVATQFFRTARVGRQGRLDRVLFAGRLAAEKNLHLVSQLARDLPSLSVSVAGDGPLRAQIEMEAETIGNLHYLGWLNREELLRQIDAHDVLVLPSQVETFGTVALEAMSRERLVVVSADCGIVNWKNLTSCLLVMEPGEKLTDTLGRARSMSDQERLQLAGRAARAAREFNGVSRARWQSLLAEVAAS